MLNGYIQLRLVQKLRLIKKANHDMYEYVKIKHINIPSQPALVMSACFIYKRNTRTRIHAVPNWFACRDWFLANTQLQLDKNTYTYHMRRPAPKQHKHTHATIASQHDSSKHSVCVHHVGRLKVLKRTISPMMDCRYWSIQSALPMPRCPTEQSPNPNTRRKNQDAQQDIYSKCTWHMW